MNYIKVKGLSKSYSEIKALKNLSMEIEAGTLFGILGPNGAGKSTLIKILATLIEPDSGEVLINKLKKSPDDLSRAKSLFRWSILYMFGICLLLLISRTQLSVEFEQQSMQIFLSIVSLLSN